MPVSRKPCATPRITPGKHCNTDSAAAWDNSSLTANRVQLAEILRLIHHGVGQTEIKTINDKFAYRLGIVERITLDTKLTSAQVEKLDAGDIAIAHNNDIMYHRLGLSSKILVVGPLSASQNTENTERLPLELRLRLLTWSLIGVFMNRP